MAGTSYEESYADISVHRVMLDDEPRNMAYQKAILGNRMLFEGKVVMDVGCGTGILSIFCAQAGARTVHAVECSSIANLARKVVTENGFEAIIKVHRCKVEELNLDEQIDVIVSEWMGFYLVHEGMLPSVIYARDSFLKPGGLIFPEEAELFVAACELPRYFSDWEGFYGVKMNSVGEYDRQSITEPVVTTVKTNDLLTEPYKLATFSMATVTCDDLKKITRRVLSPAKRHGQFQGLCLWFVVIFPTGDVEDFEYQILSTQPGELDTHWKQTAIVFQESNPVSDGEPLAFDIKLESKEDDPRKYNITVELLDAEAVEHPTPCSCYLTKCIVIKRYLEQAMSMASDLLEE